MATNHHPRQPTETTPAPPKEVRRGRLVTLKRHTAENREAFIRWYRDPDIAYTLRHDLQPLTRIQAAGYFDTIILPMSARGVCWAIYTVDGNRLIGSTALTEIDERRGTCLFRIVIGEKEDWGKGYGTEATRLVVDEAFEHLGLGQVRLEVFSHNERAQRAYARVGFHVTGEHTEWIPGKQFQLHVIEMAIDRLGPDQTHERPS